MAETNARNILDNLKQKNAVDDLLSSLRELWAEQFQPI